MSRFLVMLLLIAVPGAAGYFGGRWSHEGLLPADPARRARLSRQPASPAAREPKVEPSSPEGKWMTRVKATASGDFAALFDELDAVFPKATASEARDAAQKWLLAHWIDRDAAAVAEYVAAKNDKFLGSNFGLVLASVAPEKVAAILSGPLKDSFGDRFGSTVLRALADTDPREFLKVDASAAGDDFNSHYARAMKNLATTDPVAASEAWLRRGAKAPGGKDALYALTGVWLASDPQAARRWVDALEDPEARRLAQHAWLGALAKKDVAAARRELAGMDLGVWLPGRPGGMDEPTLQYPQDARMIVLAALARENFAAAVAELENMVRLSGQSSVPGEQDRSGDSAATLLRSAIADAAAGSLPDDPAALFAAFSKLGGNDAQPLDPNVIAAIRQGILDKKMAGWDARTSLEALRLLGSNRISTQAARDPALVRAENLLPQLLVSKAVYADPGGAVNFIAALPGTERGRMAQLAFGALEGKDTQLLAQTAAMVPPELWTKQMGEQLGRSPQDFAGMVAGLPDTSQTGAARTAFSQSWAKLDPEAAAQWVAILPSNAGATAASHGLTEGWAAYDDTAASAWAASLPQGPARDGAALGLATAVAAAEPEAAWQWAAFINDAKLSADAFWNVARVWGREASPEFRASFSAALDRGGYAGDIKARALRDLDGPRQLTQPPPGP